MYCLIETFLLAAYSFLLCVDYAFYNIFIFCVIAHMFIPSNLYLLQACCISSISTLLLKRKVDLGVSYGPKLISIELSFLASKLG